MEWTSARRLGALALVASLATLGACESDKAGSSVAVPAAVPATEQPATVIGESYVETEATIQAIDKKTRSVNLRMADGTTQTVTAPADADLSRVKKGDVVILGAYQKLSVRALPPGSVPLGVTLGTAAAKAQPGETPSRAVADVLTAVWEVAAVDVANNTVTLRGADGTLRTLDVKIPENQQKLKTLKAGDLVEIELIEAAIIGLKPRA